MGYREEGSSNIVHTYIHPFYKTILVPVCLVVILIGIECNKIPNNQTKVNECESVFVLKGFSTVNGFPFYVFYFPFHIHFHSRCFFLVPSRPTSSIEMEWINSTHIKTIPSFTTSILYVRKPSELQ